MVKRYGVSKGFSKQSSPERAPRKENPKSKNNHTPKHPTLRANPFPKVTDLICRLPLSALFYQLEAVHLGDLLRWWVRPGVKLRSSPSDFQGPSRAHRTAQNRTALPSMSPHLRVIRFRGQFVKSWLKRKENSSQGSCWRLRVCLRCRIELTTHILVPEY